MFPSHRGSGHLVNISKAWRRIRERAGLQDVRIHDLRRTVGSMLKAAGEDLTLISKVLNHSQLSTTAIYARLNLDPVRKALGAHATQLEEMFDNHSIKDEREVLLTTESAKGKKNNFISPIGV